MMNLKCSRCGANVGEDAKFCRQCGVSISCDPSQLLSWRFDVPLLTNKFMLKGVGIWLAITLLICFVIFGSIFGYASGFKGIMMAFYFCLGFGAFMAIISVFTLGIVLGNKNPVEFIIQQDCIIMKNRSERAKTTHRLAIILGVLGRSATTTGAGLIAASKEIQTVQWNEIKSVTVFPEEKVIGLKLSFIQTMHVFCTEQNFQHVVELIREKTKL